MKLDTGYEALVAVNMATAQGEFCRLLLREKLHWGLGLAASKGLPP